MDVLTDVLAVIRRGTGVSTRTVVRAPWGLRFPAAGDAGFHVVIHGTCWLLAPQAGVRQALTPGDVVLLPRGQEHVLADSPDSPVADLTAVARDLETGSGPFGGDGPETVLLCGRYIVERSSPHPLLSALPDVVYLPGGRASAPELHGAVELLAREVQAPGHGSRAIVDALVDALFAYILRGWLEQLPAECAGWRTALSDPAIQRALDSIHAEPARPWTVRTLADVGGLSRAAFARRFTELVGEPPMAYVTRWRMIRAGDLLRADRLSLNEVARTVGYESPFAFAKAFKRYTGSPPGRYRDTADPPLSG